MAISESMKVTELQPPPIPGFALTYVGSLPTPDLGLQQSRRRTNLRAAATGMAIQLAVGAVIGVVALVFIEDLHSEDDPRPTTTSTASVS